MLIDMHLHELTHSSDSFIDLSQIVTVAKQKGLDAICITDHDSMGLRDYAEEYSKKVNFPIFVGIEFLTHQGDITAWGIDDYPADKTSAQEFIDHVQKSGGFSVSCHPFRQNNRSLEDHLLDVKGLHGIEVLNGSTPLEANQKALRYCQELGLKPIGASDAHRIGQIGKFATWLPEKVDNLKDFITQLHSGPTKPAIYNGISYDIVEAF